MVKIKDIIGYKKEVEKLKSIKDFLKNTVNYVNFGVELPLGVLIFGETGVGKTFWADVLATDSERDIWYVFDEDLTVKGIKKIFKQAKKFKNAIICIDDIDRLDKENDADVYARIVSEMHSCENGDVFLIVTADDKEYIPDYFLDEFHPSMLIKLEPPNIEDSCEIFKPIFDKNKVKKDFNINDFCCFAQDWTYSEIEDAFNDAARLAIYEKQEKISMQHLIKAGLALKGLELAEKFDIATAYHEVGHAAVSLLLGGDAACIVLHGDGYGFFKEKNWDVKTYRDRERRYIVSVAGKACEEVFTGTSSIQT